MEMTGFVQKDIPVIDICNLLFDRLCKLLNLLFADSRNRTTDRKYFQLLSRLDNVKHRCAVKSENKRHCLTKICSVGPPNYGATINALAHFNDASRFQQTKSLTKRTGRPPGFFQPLTLM